MRYIRAFWQALILTIRGKTISSPKTEFDQWCQKSTKLLEQVEQSLIDQVEQPTEGVELKIDGRTTTAKVVLDILKHNLSEEYPRLLALQDEYQNLVIQATNVDDQHRIQKLQEVAVFQNPNIQTKLKELVAHLDKMPIQHQPNAQSPNND